MKYRTIETQIPWKYKWKAISGRGLILVYTNKPLKHPFTDFWYSDSGEHMEIGEGPKPKDWTKTIVKL